MSADRVTGGVRQVDEVGGNRSLDVMSVDFEPRIVSFLCNWCSHSTAEGMPGAARRPPPLSIRVIKVTCTGRVDPLFIITVYLRSADGVLVTGCWPGQCHYKEGNYHARRRVALVKNIFETLGLDADRLHIERASDSEGRYFAEIATEFDRRIQQQGPNATRSEVFC